ncbi:hypothetical protein VIN01S_15130 [Vibrio inusitatus NBRC 102082]|uniref:Pili assembly chaperone N-terminal domain-containing protein n=1 Tax=Vibrio inusitatus NBRC 102082 TaxID=1219070 RepID=A0A4Y3HU91_9VIBR|nr:fimbria/pilus periplasmic chaperone [Vibrio inusitatus]GEA50709.1 hypothetical protein VIN01S_15130 [Vibrio inusitatus NBRC 102082]
MKDLSTSILLVFLLGLPFNTAAYQVSPMFQLFEVAGTKSQGSYEVDNTDASDVILEAVVYRVGFNKDGTENLIRSDEEFLVLPPQSKIKAGESQRFRVRYLGNVMLPQTQTFRLVFEQIQTSDNPGEDSGTVEILVDFSTVIFVSPLKCDAKVLPKMVSGQLELSNPSNCVYDLNQSRFEFSGSGSSTISWMELQVPTAGYLLPKSTQKVQLPEDYDKYSEVIIVN